MTDKVTNSSAEADVRLISFYLPQYHPIPENDEWWGKGFTEWTNVSKAKPLFEGHYQPHLPSDLGFYDLRLPEVRQAQADLARAYGIYGFCYYYYWFSGRRVLERPLQEVFESGKPDFPFCICWANESWSRRWDGSEQLLLLKQEHNTENDEKFIYDVLPLFKDKRYIRVNGAPLLIIYRVSLMPEPEKTADMWRKVCAENGIEKIHLCAAESFGIREPRNYGFDTAVEFPPHAVVSPVINKDIKGLPGDYSGNIYDYAKVVQFDLNRTYPPYKRYPGVMLSWDNTPRRGKAGNIFLNASPELYEIWLRGAIDSARDHLPEGERLVFINAWNEWAEGTHLEPDQKYGRQYLEATSRALSGRSDWRLLLDYGRETNVLAGETKNAFLSDIRSCLERYERSLTYLMGLHSPAALPYGISDFTEAPPLFIEKMDTVEGGTGQMERINQYDRMDQAVADRKQALFLKGWAFCESKAQMQDVPTYFILQDMRSEKKYYAPILHRVERSDVAAFHPDVPAKNTKQSGFAFLGNLRHVPVGEYRLAIIHVTEDQCTCFTFEKSFKVV